MLKPFKEKVKQEVQFRSHGSKKVKTTKLKIGEIPYIKFELVNKENNL